jgi:hypothetical protein
MAQGIAGLVEHLILPQVDPAQVRLQRRQEPVHPMDGT